MGTMTQYKMNLAMRDKKLYNKNVKTKIGLKMIITNFKKFNKKIKFKENA